MIRPNQTGGTGKPVPYNGTRDKTVGEGLAPPVLYFSCFWEKNMVY